MAYYNHPDYDNALRQAAIIARQYPIDSQAGARVWYDRAQDKMDVASRDDPNFSNTKLETVAYAQKWAECTVQIREAGAISTFMDF